MTKKRTGGLDSRQEPLPSGTPADSVTNYKVDRVFAPTRSRESASQVAAALLERTRPAATASPSTGSDGPDTELSLRRQLSRLQRQLSEAQRELANKDDELASEVEKRMQVVASHDALTELHARSLARVEELAARETHATGMEQRLQDAIATADELARVLERERQDTVAARARIEELTVSFDETRALWSAERTLIEERSKAELAELERQRKSAVDSAEDALAQAVARMREGHEAELAELRAAHERSLSTLRGELEPKALEAHSLAEERERLAGELSALRKESLRMSVDRDEAHQRETEKLAETYAAELATLSRTQAADLARARADNDERLLALQQAVRAGETREQQQSEAAEALREAQKQLQREVAALKERCTALESDKSVLDTQLALASASTETLLAEKRTLADQLDASAGEARRNALDRMRFVAYLEEGLALLGALPPTTAEAGDKDDDDAPRSIELEAD